MELARLSVPRDDSVDEVWEDGEEENVGVRLSVTQSGDPLSGGHFALGVSKPPLLKVRTGTGARIWKKKHLPRARQRT